MTISVFPIDLRRVIVKTCQFNEHHKRPETFCVSNIFISCNWLCFSILTEFFVVLLTPSSKATGTQIKRSPLISATNQIYYFQSSNLPNLQIKRRIYFLLFHYYYSATFSSKSTTIFFTLLCAILSIIPRNSITFEDVKNLIKFRKAGG